MNGRFTHPVTFNINFPYDTKLLFVTVGNIMVKFS